MHENWIVNEEGSVTEPNRAKPAQSSQHTGLVFDEYDAQASAEEYAGVPEKEGTSHTGSV